MSNGLGLMIESLVAVLLLLTIGFCLVLNGRLKKLKADEQALKATISELITATEIAERAIAGLKMTVRDCDQNLSERLGAGEALAGELGRQLEGGRQVLAQLVFDSHFAGFELVFQQGQGVADDLVDVYLGKLSAAGARKIQQVVDDF